MRRHSSDDDLPDGIIPLPREPQPQDEEPGGCGFVGCSYTLVGFFVLLLIIMLGIIVYRGAFNAWPTPPVQPR